MKSLITPDNCHMTQSSISEHLSNHLTIVIDTKQSQQGNTVSLIPDLLYTAFKLVLGMN